MPSDRVLCPRCDQANPPGVKFCGECGSRLEVACPACQTANPPTNRFCHGCGGPLGGTATASPFASPQAYTPKHLADKILTSRSALEGERKQVTVLFVDVSGFTGLSERLDPEDVHRLMTRTFELMLAEVHRYEGTVNQFLGDGIMALFGAPIAHEDHAQRAVHAALGIRQALDAYQEALQREHAATFQVRQGLNTGLVVVGSIGSDLRMDYTAVGDTTNVAARLQQLADRGRIVVSESTNRLVEGYFHTRFLGPQALKGKTEPVGVWEVLSAREARTRLEVTAERGLTPYVGRERELRTLTDLFDKARAGSGQAVFLVGEAGIGKSRLLHELRQRLGGEANWLEGHCVSFGRSIAFHPVIDLLKRTFRIEEGDGEQTIARKVELGVVSLGEDLRPLAPYLRYLLAIDPGDPAVVALDPRRRRAEIFDAFRRLLVRASEIRPLVVVYEDAHWIDQASEGSLLITADSVPRHRILLILTYRPGYQHPFGDRTYHTRVALTALPAESSVEMAKGVLAAARLPEGLPSLVVGKAEGNPFFVEEVIKSLQEVGTLRRVGDDWALTRPLDEVVIPDTIQDVIMARIDRLEEAPKKTLQLASVIGREFTRRLLDRIAEIRERTEDFLQELKAIELIHEKALFPELAYMFNHALTHEVAYNSLLMQRRRELHRLIGHAIEELYADRLSEHYEVLAHHFSRAEEWSRALDYLVKAAEKASRGFAVREAVSLYGQALEAAAHLGPAVPIERRLAMHRAKAAQHFVLGEFAPAQAEGQRVLALAREAGDRVAEAIALASIGFTTLWAQDLDGALAYAGQAVEAARAAGARAALGSGYLTTGYVHALAGRLPQAQETLPLAVENAAAAGDAANHSLALQLTSFLHSWQGEWGRAADVAAEALGIARAHGLLAPLIRGLWAQGVVLTGKGDYEPAQAAFEESLALAERVGDINSIPRCLNSLAWLLSECGDYERAIEMFGAAAERARKWPHAVGVEITAYCEVNRADVFLDKGDLSLAGEFLEQARRIVEDPATYPWMKWRYAMHLRMSQGEFALARGDMTQAQELTREALDIAAKMNARKYLVRGWRLSGEIALARRQWEEAERDLRRSVAMAQVIGNPPQLWRSHGAMGRFHTARKNAEAAHRAFDAGRAIVETMKTHLQRPELRAALERAPLVQELYDRSGDRE
ncbi:MAG TPA: adenylate/guanylate cyclase domain-containing protein [Methylomirabilota bacterium]|nr:adenylate/guanylate cyclase domain-containing protein [Methylomirabilota bacterium]